MPIPGDASNLYGVRFEGKWTVLCLSRVLAEEVDSIRLQPPDNEGQGVEFFIRSGDKKQFHQVKRQHGGLGGWSIAILSANGVLDTAFEKTNDLNASFVFMSSVSADPLQELTDSAKRALSFSEYSDEFLKGSKREAWKQLLREWKPLIEQEFVFPPNTSDPDKGETCSRIAFERLQRLEIRNQDETSLTEGLETKLRTLVRGDPEKLRNDLASFALENVHQELFAEDIWRHLESLGYHRVDYSRDTSVLASVNELNKRYESMIKPLREGINIPREETDTILNVLHGQEPKRSVLVSGEAGVGKTGILGQVIHQIAGVPHLYFRVDRLDPTELPSNVGKQLGLPASPVEVLAGIARGRTSILVIDQLDAVSMASGRNPEFFDCIHEILRQTKTFPEMRLLLACRKFDLEKDNRLRELASEDGVATEIVAKPFSPERVKDALKKLGSSTDKLSERQLELLRLPLHLSIYADIINSFPEKAEAFKSSVDLFDLYWERKRKAVQKRLAGLSDQWIEVVSRLCDEMTKRQTLFVHENIVLDDFDYTVRAMESEHVLVLDEKRIGFFHEGFFDYSFARQFVARGDNLISYLKAGEQHLFKRASMRQILIHEYEAEPDRFIQDLNTILWDKEIRFHIKKSALELVAMIDDANDRQWQVFEKAICNGTPALVREVWGLFFSSPSWFSFLYDRGKLRDWLSEDDSEIRDRALIIIRNHIKTYPEESVALLSPYVGKSSAWNSALLHTVWLDTMGISRSVFDLFLSLVEIDMVDSDRGIDFWMCIQPLPKQQPKWAAEALGVYLSKTLEGIEWSDIECRFLNRHGYGERAVIEIAEQAPEAYLDNVLPSFLKIMTKTAHVREGKLMLDTVWGLRCYRDEHLSVEDALLSGLENALCAVAKDSPQHFQKYVDRIYPFGNYDSANFLLVRAFAAGAGSCADQAIEYLLENPRRFECGWGATGGGDSSYWAMRELVGSASRFCSDSVLAAFEKALMGYYPQWERSTSGYKQRGYFQTVVLPAIDSERRSKEVDVRIAEWRRKFPDQVIRPPVPMKVRMVGSPIRELAVQKMSDEHWLRAISKYVQEDGNRFGRDGASMGGAHQLSGLLEAEAKRDPTRFAKLALRFPDNVHPFYFQSIMRALREGGAPKDLAFEVIERVDSIPSKPAGHWICGLIKAFSKEDIPENVVRIAAQCATESDDPKPEELKLRSGHDDEGIIGRDLLGTAINSVRGVAAETIGYLIFDKQDRFEFFKPYLDVMVRDPATAVRTTVAYALLAVYKCNEQLAVDLFLGLCDTEDETLLATRHVDQFLYYANIRHFERLRPILRQMLDSDLSEVREAGSRHVCLAQFANPNAKQWVDECVSGDDAKRKGAVRVAEANVLNDECRSFSHDVLRKCFDDPVKNIRDEAATCFRNSKGDELIKCRDLIRQFLESKAFAENIHCLTWALKETTADISEDICAVCERLIDVINRSGIEVRPRLFVEADAVAELVIRVYRQSAEESFRTRCLDLIDRLLAMEAYGITKQLEEFER